MSTGRRGGRASRPRHRSAPRPDARARRSPRPAIALALGVLLAAVVPASAQQLRFAVGHREIRPPDHASFRFGPFYSSASLSLSAGIQYSDGTTNVVGTYGGYEGGLVRKNGLESPLIATLTMQNYWPIASWVDVNVGAWARYEYYPFETQEDVFIANVTDPEVLGELATTVSMQFEPLDGLRLKIYDLPAYLISYVDPRGEADRFGGRRYRRFENTVGIDADWLMSRHMNLGASVSRYDLTWASSDFEDQKQTAYRAAVVHEYQADPLLVVGWRADLVEANYRAVERGDYSSRSVAAFARAELTPRCRGSASVGYSWASLAETEGGLGKVDDGTLIAGLSLQTELTRAWSHSVYGSRSQRSGFGGGIEVATAAGTDLDWKGEWLHVGGGVGLNRVEVGGPGYPEYQSWFARLVADGPLTEDTDWRFSSTYSVTRNSSGADPAGLPLEVAFDHTTWVHRFEVRRTLTRRSEIDAYADHATRRSDRSELEYRRWTVGVLWKYTYEF